MMEIDVKQRNQRTRRRVRAQRMQAERDRDVVDGGDPDSAEEEQIAAREKPVRPPLRRKKPKEPAPLLEEDIIDGFAILAFKSYEDLEYAIKIANKRNEKRLSAITELTALASVDEKPPKIDTGQRDKDRDRDNRDRERDWQYQNHVINNNHQQGNLIVNHLTHNALSTIAQDPGTSDDSGRASERLTTSSVAPRDADSSRDRLSDASSRCSSGKGYICDSEGDDDKGSDGGSVVFASTPTQITTTTPSPAVPRKSDFPTTGLPLSNGPLGLGGSASPVPVPPGPGPAPPAPSPAPAALPPPSLPPPYPTPMQVSNSPISTHLPPISNSQQQQLPSPFGGKSLTGNSGKLPVCPPGGAQTPASTGKQIPSVSPQHQPHSPVAALPQALQNTTAGKPCSMGSVSNLLGTTASAPLTTIANGYSSAIPPNVTSTHPVTTPGITSPGLATGQQAASNQQPASLPVGVPQPPPATAPTAPPAATLPPGLDSAVAGSGRTNSPAVATSAVLSAAAPAINGNSSAVTSIVATNSNIPPVYRSAYPSYPLYAPYSNLHHSPYLPPAVPSPTASPRTAGSVDVNRTTVPGRGDSPVVLTAASKSIRPMTPNSNGSNNSTGVAPASHMGRIDMQSGSMPGLHSDIPTIPKAHSPRGHSPTRERDSYSNVSSLSRSSATPGSAPYNSGGSSSGIHSVGLSYNPATGATQSPLSSVSVGVSSSLSYAKSAQTTWSSTQLSSTTNTSLTRPTPPPVPVSIPSLHSVSVASSTPGGHTFPPPLFAAPLPPAAVTTTTAAPHPFSAESLFQSSKADQADLLRRELDNRFLDRSGLNAVQPSPYLRQELHHHQHQHTHLHQHQQIITSTPSAPAPLFAPPMFKDIPKMGAVDSPFYRTGLGMPAYPGYSPTLLHPGLSGPTPFVPPSHLPTFAQKKTGRWNAMHVRIAWEIYHHQTKQNSEKAPAATMGLSAKTSDLLRPPSHIFPPSPALGRAHDLSTSAFPQSALPGRTPFEPASLSTSFLTTPASHLGSAVSPFGRYVSPFGGSPFTGLSPFSRDLPLGGHLSAVHDPWRSALPRTIGSYSPAPGQSAWPLKPEKDSNVDAAAAAAAAAARREAEERERERELREREREQRERERQRREREERERQREREREEKRKEQERERERERERRREINNYMERERMMQQQRLVESNKIAASGPIQRDRSPLRNGTDDVRVKEEPRKEDTDLLMRTDPRYNPSTVATSAAVHHPYLAVRHSPHVLAPPPPHLARSILPPTLGAPPPITHFPPPPGPTWAIDPYRDPYRLDSMLRYNPLLEAFRAEEERAKVMNAYAAHSTSHLRVKEPSPVPPPPPSSHHRLPPVPLKPPTATLVAPGGLPLGTELHKKDDSTQPR